MKIKLIAVVALLFVTGCIKSSLDSQRESLEETAKGFYNHLMWKYYDRCTFVITPVNRAEFELFALGYKDKLHITSYQFRLFDISTDDDSAVVMLLMTYYLYPSVTERTVILQDKWVRKGKTWLLDNPDYKKVFKNDSGS